ncbi:hypothetical protein SUDANB51_07336 [Streptomyces sp. enrichment culture]
MSTAIMRGTVRGTTTTRTTTARRPKHPTIKVIKAQTVTAWTTAMVAMPLTPATRGMSTTNLLTTGRTRTIWTTQAMTAIWVTWVTRCTPWAR